MDNTLNCLKGTLSERRKCRSKCTIQTCSLLLSYWTYRPNVPVNAIFLGISLALVFVLSVQAFRSKGFRLYTVVVFIGLAMESVGYAERIYAYSYPFGDVSFITQLTCLTLAPAFFAAGIYFSLSRIVTTVGADISRISPKKIPRIFISCDVISLFLQAAGGAISAIRAENLELPDPGNDTFISGLSFQSLTLVVFLGLAVDFAIRAVRRVKKYGEGALNDEPSARQLRKSREFKGLIFSLTVTAALIFGRSVYRIAELSEGWKGHLMSTERFVVLFEFIPVAVAGLLLAYFHPGFCFRMQAAPTPYDGSKLKSGDIKYLELMYDFAEFDPFGEKANRRSELVSWPAPVWTRYAP